MSDEQKKGTREPMALSFPDRIQPWFFLLVQVTGWAGLVYDGLRPPKDVSVPLAFIFVGMILGARGLQLMVRRGESS